MAVKWVSPGMYSDGRRTVRATTAAQAAQLLGQGSASKPKTPAASGTPGAPAGATPQQVYDDNLKMDTAGQLINTSLDLGKKQTQQANSLTNPNQYGPFANQQVTYDANGTPIINTQLSQGNQNVVSGYQGAAGSANTALSGILNDGIFTGNPQNSSLTDAVFKQLTQGVDQRKAKDLEQLEQTLANRGIPVGSQLYNDQVKQLNDQYNDVYSNAQYQAVQQGNNFGLQAAGQLANIGRSGYFDANLQPFQAQPYNQVDVNSVFNTLTGAKLTEKDLANKLQIARLGYGGRGSSGGSSNPSDAFPNPIITTV